MDFKKKAENLVDELKRLYSHLDKMSGGILGIIRETFERFGETRGSETAASLAYYAFFSIFPMLLVFIVVGSFFVDIHVVRAQLLNLLRGVVPGVEEIVIQNLNEVLELRGTVTIFALVSLTWSSLSVFNLLAVNINRAFPKKPQPGMFQRYLMGFLMMVGLGLLLFLSLGTSVFAEIILDLDIPVNGKALRETFLWRILIFFVPAVFNTLMFWALYQWVPTGKVRARASFIGALVAGLAWEVLNRGFGWYISSGLTEYRLVYGSVGTIIALLFWVYLTAIIALIGAHLSASIHYKMSKKLDEN